MSLFIIRHGQTDYNAELRFQGQMDIPLNPVGRGQAVRNGRMLKEILGEDVSKYDFVASPLGRARETMEIIRGGLGLAKSDYRTDRRVIEINFGDWEGHTSVELENKFPELYAEREANKWNFKSPGEQAESYAMLADRVAPFLHEINKPTICVCHGGVMRAMLHIKAQNSDINAASINIPQDEILSVDGRNAVWI